MERKVEVLNAMLENFSKENEIDNKFDLISIYQYLKEKNIDMDDIEKFSVDGGNDGGIDFIIMFVNDELIVSKEQIDELIQEKNIKRDSKIEIYCFQIKEKVSFEESVLMKIESTLSDLMFSDKKNLNDIKSIYNIKLLDSMETLEHLISKTQPITDNIKFDIVYISKGNTEEISAGVRNKEKILEKTLKDDLFINNSSIKFVGATELMRYFYKTIQTEFTIKYKKLMQCSFNNSNGEQGACIAEINISEYFKLITDENGMLRQEILEDNIRDFEGNVEVNKSIQKTLKDEKEIEFWWLNNGITMLVDNYIPLANDNIKINNPKIVNGLQTTYCIYNCLKNIENLKDENRAVIVKIINAKEAKVADRVIACTNSQTEVRSAQLKATDEIQREIENIFLSKGYFYERRKNFYKNKGVDRKKIFTIEKTAQYMESIVYKNPSKARNNPTVLLKSEENYNKIFNNKSDINIYLNICLIYSKIAEIFKYRLKQNDELKAMYSVEMTVFLFHICMICVMRLVGTTNYNEKNVLSINMEMINKELVEFAIIELLNLLNGFMKENTNVNVINIAKSKSFDDYIKEKIKFL